MPVLCSGVFLHNFTLRIERLDWSAHARAVCLLSYHTMPSCVICCSPALARMAACLTIQDIVTFEITNHQEWQQTLSSPFKHFQILFRPLFGLNPQSVVLNPTVVINNVRHFLKYIRTQWRFFVARLRRMQWAYKRRRDFVLAVVKLHRKRWKAAMDIWDAAEAPKSTSPKATSPKAGSPKGPKNKGLDKVHWRKRLQVVAHCHRHRLIEATAEARSWGLHLAQLQRDMRQTSRQVAALWLKGDVRSTELPLLTSRLRSLRNRAQTYRLAKPVPSPLRWHAVTADELQALYLQLHPLANDVTTNAIRERHERERHERERHERERHERERHERERHERERRERERREREAREGEAAAASDTLALPAYPGDSPPTTDSPPAADDGPWRRGAISLVGSWTPLEVVDLDEEEGEAQPFCWVGDEPEEGDQMRLTASVDGLPRRSSVIQSAINNARRLSVSFSGGTLCRTGSVIQGSLRKGSFRKDSVGGGRPPRTSSSISSAIGPDSPPLSRTASISTIGPFPAGEGRRQSGSSSSGTRVTVPDSPTDSPTTRRASFRGRKASRVLSQTPPTSRKASTVSISPTPLSQTPPTSRKASTVSISPTPLSQTPPTSHKASTVSISPTPLSQTPPTSAVALFLETEERRQSCSSPTTRRAHLGGRKASTVSISPTPLSQTPPKSRKASTVSISPTPLSQTPPTSAVALFLETSERRQSCSSLQRTSSISGGRGTRPPTSGSHAPPTDSPTTVTADSPKTRRARLRGRKASRVSIKPKITSCMEQTISYSPTSNGSSSPGPSASPTSNGSGGAGLSATTSPPGEPASSTSCCSPQGSQSTHAIPFFVKSSERVLQQRQSLSVLKNRVG